MLFLMHVFVLNSIRYCTMPLFCYRVLGSFQHRFELSLGQKVAKDANNGVAAYPFLTCATKAEGQAWVL